jgi:hypothetical protein
MIAGVVSSGGHVLTGTGFALTRTGPGAYAIRFLEALAEAPVVLATPTEPATMVAAVGTVAGAEVTVTNLSGTRADGGFAFAVMEPPLP